MRLKKALLVFLISTANLTYGQIKIGDNPQNINQSSVLELESTSRALVITRVNTSQMNAITPLQGAMVYNTSTQCIHYYNGSQWLNLCDALANSVNISLVDNGDGTYTFSDANNNLTEINNLNESLVVEDGSLILTDTTGNAISVELQNLSAQTFTTDATAPREFPSILITTDANGTNFNFEVGVIDGLSIQDGSIRQIDLAGASVGSVQLRDNSVGNLAIADNAVGSLEIINGSVQPIDLGPGNSNQILTTNGAGAVQWVDQTGLVSADEVTYNNAISNLTANNVQEALDEVTNNINTLTIGDILTQGNDAANQNIRNVTDPSLPQDAATKNYVDQAITAGTADGSETILNNGTNINITGTGTSGSPYVINNTFTEVDGSVTNEIQSLSQVLGIGNAANNRITNVTEPVAAQDAATKAYVDAQVGGSAQVIVSGNTPNSIIPGTDGGALYNDGDSDDTNELSDLTFNAGTSILTLSNPATPANSVDLSSLSGTGTDDQNLTGASLSGTILQIDIENGSSATVDLGTLSGVDTDDQTLSLSGNEISISEGNTIDLTPILSSGGSDDQQLTLSGTTLTLEDGGTPIDLTPFLDDTDDQTITDFTFNNATNILTLTIDGGNTDTADLSALAGGGNPAASDVTFTPIGNTASNNVQLAIEELQTEIDGISGGGAANPNDELITSFTLTGTNLNIAEGANVLPPVDLSSILGTDDQTANEVIFTPSGNTVSNDVQSAIEELQIDIDGFVGGEVNTASNQGIGGVATFIQKTGVDLEFKSINAASNKVSVTNDGANNEVDIDINEGNLTITESQISDLAHTLNTDNQSATDVPYDNSIVALLTATTTQGALDELASSATGESNTASNQGTGGVATFIQKTGVDLEFKSINAASNKVSVTNDGANNEVDIDINEANLSFTESQITDLSHTPAAAVVTFAPTGNTTSANVQAAIVEIQTEVDGIATGGEVNTASNQGSGGVATFIQKTGVDLEFKSINAASNKVSVTNDGANNEVDIDINEANLSFTESQITDLSHTPAAAVVTFAPTGNTTSANVQAAIVEIQTEVDGIATGGEVNTASNQGSGGVATFIQKTGVDLEFKSINAASNKVSVTNDGANNEVDIDINEANLSFTESQITDLSHTPAAAVVTFAPTGNTTSANVQAAIVEIQTEVDGIATGGEVNTASNQGSGGVATFIQKTGVDLEFKSINAASNKVSVTNDGANNEVDIDINEANLSFTESQITDLSHTPAAAVVTFAPTGNTTSANVQAAIVEIQTEVDGIATGGEVNTASNQGSGGVATFIQKTGVDLEFKSINAASNKVSVTNDGANNEVDIDINEANLSFTESQITDLSHTPAAAVVTFAPTGNTTSANVQAAIVEIQTEVDGIATGGEVNTASNQGTGGVATFIQKTGVDLEFKSINAASNKVSVTNDGVNNEVDININEANLVISGGPSGNIVANTISQGDIGDNAIGPSEIQSNAVSSDEIDDDSIVNVDINSAAAISGTKINPNFGTQDIITTGDINGAAVTTTGNLFVGGTISTAASGQVHPDYVFEKYFLGNSNLKKDYDFQNLMQIEDFVKKYHHLPGIKSAEEVQEDGFWNLSESNLQNLEKIEELFLHTIEQEKKLQELKSENEILSKELNSLKNDLEEIKALLKKD